MSSRQVLLEVLTGDEPSTVVLPDVLNAVLPDVLNEDSSLYHYNNKRLYYQVFSQGLENETLPIESNINAVAKSICYNMHY